MLLLLTQKQTSEIPMPIPGRSYNLVKLSSVPKASNLSDLRQQTLMQMWQERVMNAG